MVFNMTETCESLSELMEKAFCLSLELTHATKAPGGHYLDQRKHQIGTKDDEDMAFGWADGLTHKYYHDRAIGHCSLQAMIDFDIAKFEERVIKDISTMERLLKKYGKPIQLDFAEMQRRGYQGEWAGL